MEPTPHLQTFPNQRPESGTVTGLAVVSIVFGTIGLLGSFIPCLGAFAIWLAIPAALCGGGAFFLARSKGVSIGFPVAAFVVSLLGVVISSLQIMALSAAATGAANLGEEARKQLEAERKRQELVTPTPRK